MTTFVLVHGGWDGGWAWTPVVRKLWARGHDAYAPTLTGSGDRVHLASPQVDMDTHIQDVVNLLQYEDLHDVVLVGSSSGGAVITGVADRAPERISRLICLDALVPQDGESLSDLIFLFNPQVAAGMMQAAQEQGDGWRVPAFDDLENKRKTDVMVKVGQQPLTLKNGGAAHIKRTFVQFTDKADDDWTKPLFEQMADRVRQAGGWEYLERPWMHYPVLDQEGGVDAVTELLLELAA